uniref:AlNc14C57G4319 protein n=1 Tax=Albugo laibachii Nc14 TaxID=890382 RepID=F0WCD9_9STRA|nr:AlNc14C57G4319 [Albugo laibachii Nc14]|eukprot:CCA18854.1 AlNc14C57G4319 [Albugo laibachii Nc14]
MEATIWSIRRNWRDIDKQSSYLRENKCSTHQQTGLSHFSIVLTNILTTILPRSWMLKTLFADSQNEATSQDGKPNTITQALTLTQSPKKNMVELDLRKTWSAITRSVHNGNKDFLGSLSIQRTMDISYSYALFFVTSINRGV